MKRLLATGIVVILALFVAWDFAAATTFLGDDYLFRAYARLERNPFAAFVSDKHGGEYYRPVPLAVWWLLERVGNGRAGIYATFAFVEHAACAGLLVTLARRVGFSTFAAGLGGILFFVAPAGREAALWFSASTDLLGTAFGLAAAVFFLSESHVKRRLSVLFAAAAFLCKETLVVLPGLLLVARWGAKIENTRACLKRLVPHVAALVAFVVVRTLVLGGFGGSNDATAPWWGRGMQLASGVLHSVTAYAPLPEWVAWLAGLSVLVWATLVGRGDRPRMAFAWWWAAMALLPLPAAGWVVGARYFYLPSAGLCLLLALALERTSRLAAAFAVATLVVLGLASGYGRAVEVKLYRHALSAIRDGVADGLRQGHRLFYLGGAVKDVDLAVKLDPASPPAVREAVLVPDVPASFVWLPPSLGTRLDFLLAAAPLPPSGAYRFGGARVVGLARREEAPDLDDVLSRLPELRILRLQRKGAGFAVVDTTAAYQRPE